MSASYKDAEQMKRIYTTFIEKLMVHPIIGPKLAKSGMVVRFEYSNPDQSITIDFKGKVGAKPGHAGGYSFNDTTIAADVTFKQSAEFSNRFWQGKENVIAAMAKRQVTASGSITSALKLIPVIRPSFRIYPEVLKELGLSELLVE